MHVIVLGAGEVGSYVAERLSKQGVDVAVVEVGLGGRLDTTNTVRANLSVLTPIDLDHTAVLGTTPEVIAADKAGILRPGVPVVLAPQAPAVEKVLLAAAEALGAPAVLVGRDVTWDERETALGPIMDISLPGRLFPGATGGLTWPRRYKVECSLHGPYQRVNTAVAATVAAALDDTWQPVSRAAVEFGLLRTRWPGRLEQLPAASGHRTGTVVVDGAHNPHAARALAAALEDRYPGRRVVLLVGVSRGKDASGIMTALAPMAEEVVVTASRHPKALPAPDLAAVALPPGTHPHVADTVEEALEAALGLAGPADLVVATGSLFVAAAVRELWLAKLGIPMPPRDGPPVARRRPGRPR
ncbi:MAG: glutamate ligase domain-containing protein [Anaerolineae bacterium]